MSDRQTPSVFPATKREICVCVWKFQRSRKARRTVKSVQQPAPDGSRLFDAAVSLPALVWKHRNRIADDTKISLLFSTPIVIVSVATQSAQKLKRFAIPALAIIIVIIDGHWTAENWSQQRKGQQKLRIIQPCQFKPGEGIRDIAGIRAWKSQNNRPLVKLCKLWGCMHQQPIETANIQKIHKISRMDENQQS